MMEPLSRRAFVAGAGGTLAAAWIASACRPAGRRPDPPDATAGYVDRDGWMLTPEDHEKLAAAPLQNDETP
jgi:hypothetical protein